MISNLHKPSSLATASQKESVPKEKVLKVRHKELRFGTRTFLMGIVNVSPDSFSGDGCSSTQAAIDLALDHIGNGADIIDIGGQSTRPAGFSGLPGYIAVPEQIELERVLPVIEEVRKHSDVIISIDTFSPFVLERSLQAGADILNSIWAFDEGKSGRLFLDSTQASLLDLVKHHQCPVVIMHNKNMPDYPDGVATEVKDYLLQSASRAMQAGLSEHAIILDPGIGFGKTAQQSLELLSNLQQLTMLGFPTLLGTSRKSMIGKLTEREPAKRVYGTAATVTLGITSGVDIVRVHDVAQIADCAKVADAIVRGWRPEDWFSEQ